MESFTQHLDSLIETVGTIPTLLILLLGSMRITQTIGSFYRFMRQHFIHCGQPDLMKRYQGEGTWALVTGASDGIGASYCRQLAAMGFNIILVSRTEAKLQKVRDNLVTINPSIRTQIIVADFSGRPSIEFYRNILRQVGDRELSIVIANAGLLNYGLLIDKSLAQIQELIDVNVYHYAMM